MKKYFYSVISVGFLACLLVTQSGCLIAAAAAGAGASVAYVKGKMSAVLDAPPDQVIEAARLAIQELDLRLISSTSSKLEGELIARSSDDTKITINVQTDTEKTSKVNIRVGTWGDEQMSLRILDKIKQRLKKQPYYG